MWQKPKQKIPKEGPWYDASPVGHNTLEKFMGRISDLLKEKISQRYTNHCIRVTGTTNLSKFFNPKQVMAITGHKSLQSLAIYQRVHSDEKMSMSMSLTYSLLNPEETFKLKNSSEYRAIMNTPKAIKIQNQPNRINANVPVSIPAILPAPNMPITPQTPPSKPEPHALEMANILPLDTALEPYVPPPAQTPKNQSPQFDILQLLSDAEGDNDILMAASQFEYNNTTTTNKTAIMKKTASPKFHNQPMFSGCTIGTLNIHIHKK